MCLFPLCSNVVIRHHQTIEHKHTPFTEYASEKKERIPNDK